MTESFFADEVWPPTSGRAAVGDEDVRGASIFIAVPCSRGIEPLATAGLVSLTALLTAKRIRFDFATCMGDDLPCQRDSLAMQFMASDYSHMYCLDSDLGVPPDVVLRMLDRSEDFVACTYRRKLQDSRERVYTAVASLDQEPDRGTIQAEGVGAGCMLLRRRVFEDLYAVHGATHAYKVPSGPAVGVFQRMRAEGVLLGEDYSFCARWRALERPIWLMVDAPTVHTSGLLQWPGNFLEIWDDRANRPPMYAPSGGLTEQVLVGASPGRD